MPALIWKHQDWAAKAAELSVPSLTIPTGSTTVYHWSDTKPDGIGIDSTVLSPLSDMEVVSTVMSDAPYWVGERMTFATLKVALLVVLERWTAWVRVSGEQIGRKDNGLLRVRVRVRVRIRVRVRVTCFVRVRGIIRRPVFTRVSLLNPSKQDFTEYCPTAEI